MNLIQSILTKNPCYTAGKKIIVKGLMLHSVGVNQPSAMVFINQWNKASFNRACVHAFIEANGNVYQTLPWNHRAWHGGGSSNNTHIGVEMTEPSTIKYVGGSSWTDLNPAKTKAHVLGTYKASVELFAYLCKKYNLNPLRNGVIVSHSEGRKRGIASNHADVEHIWNKFGLTMNQFRQDVKKKMTSSGQVSAPPVANTPVVKNKQFVPYKVRITAKNGLNIRAGAGTKFPKNGTITDSGVYTIIKEQNGWGKLKSGAGWISLNYTKRV